MGCVVLHALCQQRGSDGNEQVSNQIAVFCHRIMKSGPRIVKTLLQNSKTKIGFPARYHLNAMQ